MSVKLNVLYASNGEIVALSRLPQRADRGERVATLRSGVEPDADERLAVVELDAGLAELTLAEIHRRFTVVDDDHGVRLKEHSSRATS